MYKEIQSILKYILQNNTEQSEDRKHITVQLVEEDNKETSAGQIQINVVGSWIKHFCINNFKSIIWNNSTTNLQVHLGDNKEETYCIYSLIYNQQYKLMSINVNLEDEPFLGDCNNYLSFVMSAKCRFDPDLLSNVKKHLKMLAPKYPDVRMSFTISESLWVERDTNEKCMKMISEAVGDIIKYSSDFQTKCSHSLRLSNRTFTTEKMYDQLLKCLSKTNSN